MTSTISSNRKKSNIKLWAAAVWLIVWQAASMWIGQEILLVSPVAVIRRLFELVQTAPFWQSLACSFLRILSGFLLGMISGVLLAAAAAASPADRRTSGTLRTDDQVSPGSIFYHSCADLGFAGEPVGDHLFADGVPCDLYKCKGRHPQHGSEPDGDGGSVCSADYSQDPVYLRFPDPALFPRGMLAGSGTVLEIRHRGGGDRASGKYDRRESVQCQDLPEYTGFVCVDACDRRGQRSL